MPPVLSAAAAFIANVFFGGFGLAAVGIAYVATYTILSVGAIYAFNAVAKALAPKPPRGRGRGLDINYAETDAPGVIVYGKTLLGGMNTIPPLTSGPSNRDLHQVLTHCLGPVNAFRDAFFDETTIPEASIGSVAGGDTDGALGSGAGKYEGQAWVRRYLGTTTQNVDFILNAKDSTMFPSTFRGRKIAYSALRYRFNDKVFSSVPVYTTIVEGLKLYDPRLDSTKAGGSGSHRDNDPTTWAYSTNPALALAHFLMDTTFGGGYLSAEIDWSTFMTAATTCDGSVSIPPSGTQARYTCNGALIANEDFDENVELLASAMLGRVLCIDGIWRAYAGSWQTPTFTVNQKDWAGPISIQFEGGRDRRYNRARCWFVDAGRRYNRVECRPRYNPTYQAADGAETIDLEMEQPLCSNEFEAQRKAELVLRQSRNQIVVTGRLLPRQVKIALWETGFIDFPELGWVLKPFRCVGYALQPDGSAIGTFSEEQSTDWSDLSSGEYNNVSIAAIPSNDPTSPSEPLNFEITPINGTLHFQWDRPTVFPSDTVYQLWSYPGSLSAVSSKILVWQGNVENAVAPIVTTSPAWWQIRAIRVGSYTSPFIPNTFGLASGTVSPSAPPGGGAGWSASVSPSSLIKSGTTSQITTGFATVAINSPTSPSYTWAQVSAVGSIAILGSSSKSGRFFAESLAAGDERSGNFKVTVTDNAGVNSVALPVSVMIYRTGGA